MDNENKPIGEQGNKNPGAKNAHYRNRKKKRHHNPNKPNDTQKSSEQSAAPVSENKAPEQRPAHNKNRNRRNKHKGPRKPNESIAPNTTEILISEEPAKEIAYEQSTELADKSIYDTEIFASKSEPAADIPRVDIIGIRFKAGGKTYYFSPNGIVAKRGAYAIVETARGQEFGEVAVANSTVAESEIVPPLRPVIRLATDADVKHHEDNKQKEESAFKICNEKIAAHELDMKLIDAQYTFDNSKLLFYFTSSGRVDFRELVKDLASVFKTRIELRQIGIRDEAKLIGGLGICGRPLCCSVFLSDFGQVSIKMAKEQNLSLNSAKISGSCGRLMCCLRYEHETYVQEIKNTPAIDSQVKTPDGIGTVVEMSPLVGKIKVRLDDKPDQPPKQYHRDEVTVLPKQK